MYWDGTDVPAVEVPLGDFFCNGWTSFSPVASLPIVVAPHRGMNSYWQMPFKTKARLTLENVSAKDLTLYYQVDYSEQEVAGDAGYFHACWRRDNPVNEEGIHELLDCPSGAGLYCGTYMAVGVNSPGWWGEGELKFYLDDDRDFPSICSTGTEDYFGGAWNFDVKGEGYTPYSTPLPFAATIWHVPLACLGPHRLRRRLEGYYPGPGLARRQDVPQASR
jgi:hypothetical protein